MFNRLKLVTEEYLGLSAGILYGGIILFFYFVVYPLAHFDDLIYIVSIFIVTVVATLFLAWHELRLKNIVKLSAGIANTISGLLITMDLFILILMFQKFDITFVVYTAIISILTFLATLMLLFSVLRDSEFKKHEEHFKYDNL
ncbi:MAG: hypothetical protein ACP5NL_05775 [Thermoplasmata archaeon]